MSGTKVTWYYDPAYDDLFAIQSVVIEVRPIVEGFSFLCCSASRRGTETCRW